MTKLIGGLTTSHVPMIGRAIAANTREQVDFAPFFAAFPPVVDWFARAKPDVAIVFYNDHGLNFFLDAMPTFAIGTAPGYRNADEGWGEPEPRIFRGDPALSWHIAQSLVADEFDITTCQDMAFDHAGITALDLATQADGGHGDLPFAVIPVVINAVQAPYPTPRRCYRLGQAIGRAVASFGDERRVVVIGSGGLSHQLGEMGSINEPFDRQCMDEMRDDPEALTRHSNADIVRLAGTQGLELMTWIAMRGALADPIELVTSCYHAPISHTGGGMMLFETRDV